MGDAGDAGRAGEQRRNGGEGEKRVGEFPEVLRDATAGRALGNPGFHTVVPVHRGESEARGHEHVCKPGIALQAVSPDVQPRQFEVAARDERQREKVTCGRGSGLDRIEFAGWSIGMASLPREAGRAASFYGRLAEMFEQAGGHLHKRPAHRAGQRNIQILLRQRRDQEQGGEQLAALACVDGDGAAVQTTRMDFEREKAFHAGAANVRAKRVEGVDQSFHRAFAHLRHAVKAIDPARRGGAQGGEKTSGGAGVADKKLSRLCGNFPALAGDLHGLRRGVGRDLDAERIERLGHDLRILAEQGVGEGDRRVAQGGEQQGAVREALRAGQRHRAARRVREGRDG